MLRRNSDLGVKALGVLEIILQILANLLVVGLLVMKSQSGNL